MKSQRRFAPKGGEFAPESVARFTGIRKSNQPFSSPDTDIIPANVRSPPTTNAELPRFFLVVSDFVANRFR